MFLCPDSVRIYAKEFQGHDSLGIAIFDHATSMGEYAFDQCAIIRTLYCSLLTIIPKFGVSHCPYLRDIDFNNVVEIKDHAFTQSGIQECYFPSATTLGHCVFESCTNLNIAYLPKVTTMGDNVFKGCNQLKWLLLPNIISDKERIRLGIPNKTHVVSDISKIPKLPHPILKKLFSRGPHIADALICLARKRFVLPKNTHQSLQNTLSQLNKNDFPAIFKAYQQTPSSFTNLDSGFVFLAIRNTETVLYKMLSKPSSKIKRVLCQNGKSIEHRGTAHSPKYAHSTQSNTMVQ